MSRSNGIRRRHRIQNKFIIDGEEVESQREGQRETETVELEAMETEKGRKREIGSRKKS